MSETTDTTAPTVASLSFKIRGEFITETARQEFYQENKVKQAFDLLLSCTNTDQVNYEERLGICIQILDGKAELTGTSGIDFGLTPTENNPSLGFFDKLGKITDENHDLKAENEKLIRKLNFLVEYFDVSTDELMRIKHEYYDEFGESFFTKDVFSDDIMEEMEPKINPVMGRLLTDYMANARIQREMSDDEANMTYGWLEPDGTYHPVDWGMHSDWAQDYLDEHYPIKDDKLPDVYYKDRKPENHQRLIARDALVYNLHWALVDSPSQGLPRAVYDTSRKLTKAQKEFLYDHYMKFNMTKEANELWEDD